MKEGRIEKYQDAGGEWRWRLKAGNGRIVADSAEGYTREADVDRAIEDMLRAAGQAVVAMKREQNG